MEKEKEKRKRLFNDKEQGAMNGQREKGKQEGRDCSAASPLIQKIITTQTGHWRQHLINKNRKRLNRIYQ